MSQATSRSGSGSESNRSSLKGWTGPTRPDDTEAVRNVNSPFGTLKPTLSLDIGIGKISERGPGSSPNLAGRLSEVPADGSKPVEQQIKQERIWWSEQTLFEVQKMELALKQELHKTTAGLREQFRRQLEIERNEGQQRAAALDRAVSRIRDFETGQQDATARAREISESVAQAEASMRLELEAMRCTLEDFQRQHAEEMSVRQAAAEAERVRMQSSTTSIQEEMAEMSQRLGNFEAMFRANLKDTDSMKERLMSVEADQSQMASKAQLDQGDRAMQQIENLRQDVRRLEDLLEEERATRVQSMGENAVTAALNAKMQDIEASLGKECHTRQSEVNSLRQEWRSEITLTAKDIAEELLKRRKEMDSFKDQLEVLESRGNDQGGATMKELAELLEIECKARKNDVDDLRHQLQLTEAIIAERTSQDVQHTLSDLDIRVGRLVNALETERDHRRSDSDRYQAALSDVADSLKAEQKIRAGEVEKMRSALAQLALNLQLASAETPDTKRMADAFASLQTALSAERTSPREGDQVMSSGMNHLGREVADLGSKLLKLSEEVKAQNHSHVEAVSQLRAELGAKVAELRDMASRMELKDNGGDNSTGGVGLQSNAALAGQMNEVVRLVQVIAAGTEHLGEKLCDEVSDRRRGEASMTQRIASVEYRLDMEGHSNSNYEPLEVGKGAPSSPMAGEPWPASPHPGTRAVPLPEGRNSIQPYTEVLRQQSMVSEGLKDSLEQLVTRVNRMLQPQERPGSRARSLNQSTAASRENSQQPGGGLMDAGGRGRTGEVVRGQSARVPGSGPPGREAQPSDSAGPTPQQAPSRSSPGSAPQQQRAPVVRQASSYVAGPPKAAMRYANPPGSMQGYHSVPQGMPVYRGMQQVAVAKAGR